MLAIMPHAAPMQDTDSLFSVIADWQAQPIGLRHPFCFYYGHVAAFSRLKILREVCLVGWGGVGWDGHGMGPGGQLMQLACLM